MQRQFYHPNPLRTILYDMIRAEIYETDAQPTEPRHYDLLQRAEQLLAAINYFQFQETHRYDYSKKTAAFIEQHRASLPALLEATLHRLEATDDIVTIPKTLEGWAQDQHPDTVAKLQALEKHITHVKAVLAPPISVSEVMDTPDSLRPTPRGPWTDQLQCAVGSPSPHAHSAPVTSRG